jgi:protein-S-isoprenylcysteine O-methyltransferase Ste14
MSEKSHTLINFIPVTLVTILFISQILIGIYLLSSVSQIEILAYFGVGLYIFSGLFFGLLPVLEFRKKGGVTSGDSYIHTTQLVDTGIFSIVRHPQYVTFLLWSLAGMLLIQHWIVILLGIPIFPLTYVDLKKADEDAILKFGDDYKIYMKKVPRANFVWGIIRKLKKENI